MKKLEEREEPTFGFKAEKRELTAISIIIFNSSLYLPLGFLALQAMLSALRKRDRGGNDDVVALGSKNDGVSLYQNSIMFESSE